jgi:hypothetical protein
MVTVTSGDGFDPKTGQPRQPDDVSKDVGIRRRDDVTVENVKKLILRAIEEYGNDRDAMSALDHPRRFVILTPCRLRPRSRPDFGDGRTSFSATGDQSAVQRNVRQSTQNFPPARIVDIAPFAPEMVNHVALDG